MNTLFADFTAMVTEMRPAWDAAEAQRCAGRAAWFAAQRGDRPAPRPLTVEDYRARVRAFDAADLMADSFSIYHAAQSESEALRRLAIQFDPDFAIWHEIDNQRRFT